MILPLKSSKKKEMECRTIAVCIVMIEEIMPLNKTKNLYKFFHKKFPSLDFKELMTLSRSV